MSVTDLVLGKVRGVLFDVDGTLYRQRRVRAEMIFRLGCSVLFNPPLPPLTVLRIIRCFRRTREQLRTARPGSGLRRLQYSAVADRLGVPVETVEATIVKYLHEMPLGVLRSAARPQMRAALRKIKDLGLKIGVYSDYPAAAKLRALGLEDRLFDVVVDSAMVEIDAFKPNPAGFLYAAGRLGLAPSEILYVGDRVDVDVAGSRSAGMAAALVTWSGGNAVRDGHRCFRDVAALAGMLAAVRP